MEPAICNVLVPVDRPSSIANTIDIAAINIRTPCLADAPAICKLVSDSGVLDSNSIYCYLLICRDFADTCVVACHAGEIIGFVTAYRPPSRVDTLFVWQIGVAQIARRVGLARRLLKSLLSLPACREVRYMDATVTPSNTASRRLFQSFAQDRDVPCRIEQGFTAEMFGSANHEQEELLRIGPFADSS